MNNTDDLQLPEVGQLEAQVQCRTNGRIYDLRLLVRDNSIILRGRSRTFHAKQLAQEAVREATGLPICNEIEVS